MAARRWHRPSLLALALTALAVLGFVRLGLWQLARAEEKTALFAAFAGAATQAPVPLAAARAEAANGRYPRVGVDGRFDPLHAYVLDNQVRDGRAGVMVFDVFEPADGSMALLLNRGFLARDARGERPSIPPPPAGAQHIDALYAPAPGAGIRLGGDALPAQRSAPKLVIYVDPAEVAHDVGRALDTHVLLALPSADAGAFVREWKPEVFPPERHLGYACTWFTFAAVAVATLAIVHWRKPDTAA